MFEEKIVFISIDLKGKLLWGWKMKVLVKAIDSLLFAR